MELLLGTLKWSMVVGAAALVLMLLKPLLDKRYSPRWRYWAWLVMAVLLLLAPVQWGELLPRREAVAPALMIEIPQMELAISREEGLSLQRPEASPALPSGGTAVQQSRPAERVMRLDQVLTSVWLLGAGCFLLYELAGTAFLQRRARRWSRSPGQETARIYGGVCREMGLRKAPPLRVSARVASPMLAGIFWPCLLLPAETYGERELRFILRHELTHYRRHDLWYKLVVLMANALHWFNPLAYLLSREAARDIELTCDAQVVAGADADTRRAYSETLLASVHRKSGFGRSALTTHFYGGAEVMKERFRNILGKQGRKWGGIALALTLLAMAATACTVGVSQAAGPEVLSQEELAVWQETLMSTPEMEPYLRRMYTDLAYVPSDELLESLLKPGMEFLGYADLDLTVVSGTQDGETVTLELEGQFTSSLTRGTLTLVDGKPVSLTNSLYTAVEKMAWDYVNGSNLSGPDVEITDRCITNIYCSDSFNLDGRSWYVWELDYWLKPADIGQVVLAGGMEERNGWVSDFYYAPIFIVSEDKDGNVVLEAAAAQNDKENGFTWQDYAYCRLLLGMEDMGLVLNGWPEIDSALIEGLQNGHETWATDWEDAARSYAGLVLGVNQPPDTGLTVLYRAQAGSPDYDESIVARTTYGGNTLTLLLTHVIYGDVSFWQVNAAMWDPEAPAVEPAPSEPPIGPGLFAGELTAEELSAFAAYFNPSEEPTPDSPARNGLLRFPYESVGDIGHYLEILFYDAGEGVTDEAEREALEERMQTAIETDCSRLTRDYIREFLSLHFSPAPSEEEITRMMEEELSLPNLAEYDAFYLVRGDTMMGVYEFERGERTADGSVKLYYTTDLFVYTDNGEMDILWDQPMCATMRSTGNDIWGMVSNTIVE